MTNKLLKLGFALGVIVAAMTPAMSAPASTDDCLSQAFNLAQTATDKKLAAEAQSKVDGLMTKLEGECSAGKFAEADATMKEITSAIGG